MIWAMFSHQPARRRLLALPWLMGAGAARAAGLPLDQALQALMDDPQQPLASVSVLVQRAGRTVHAAQFGRRYIAPEGGTDLPVTPDTLFRVASVSKLVVALGVMRLVDAGKLDLEADISGPLGFSLRNPLHPDRPISVRLLLSHLSSLRDGGGAYLEPGQTLKSRLTARSASWSAEAPGDYFSYCNLNYGVLASVMERASGQRFDRLMQEQVLGPLGMAGGFDATQLSAEQLGQVATLYRKRSDESQGEVWNPTGPWVAQTDDFRATPPVPVPGLASYELGSNGSLFGPQGRLRTRVSDLGRVMAMLAAGGLHEGRPFLQPHSVAALLTERWRHDPAFSNGDDLGGLFQAWGLGLQHFIDRSRPRWGDRLVPQGGREAWGHLGFAYGLQSALIFDPQSQTGIAYVIGGIGADPERARGAYSSFPIWEEKLQALLWAAA